MSQVEQHLRDLAPDTIRINVWPRSAGGFQVNVSERGSTSWTVVVDDDPVAGLTKALQQRATGSSGITVEAHDGYADAPLQAEEFDGCMICENGGCDACHPVDDFEGLL